ncbi:MAG: GTP cyclohydrolase I FolE [Lentisphaeria bacterium]|nr:GTP cyclohydrolase I FolE [Lentisphaeria bacterium]
MEQLVSSFFQLIGEDGSREGLVETPARVRMAAEEIFSGYRQDPKKILKTFTQDVCKEMVILKNCEFYSTCEHHLFPFFGHISVAYLPNRRIVGISKLARLVDCFARRLQIQERMTAQIADAIMDVLDARGVYVMCEATHFCMTSRGIRKQNASMVTTAIRGAFEKSESLRLEFLAAVTGNISVK